MRFPMSETFHPKARLHRPAKDSPQREHLARILVRKREQQNVARIDTVFEE